jgi:hypothetical protein
MLTIRGAKGVADAIAYYKAHGPAGKTEPPGISGSLWKSGRTGARFFRTEPGTPLLLYFRSKRLVDNHVVAAHAALDLSSASKIAVVSQNGVGTSKFVVQATDPRDPNVIEHVELTATSPDEARRWTTALLERRAFFAGTKSLVGGRRPSQQELAQAGMALFRRATEEGMVVPPRKETPGLPTRASDLAKSGRASDLSRKMVESGVGKRTSELKRPELNRLSSTGSAVHDEVYFSASSDDEQPDGEHKSLYMSQQARLEQSMADLTANPPSSFPEKMWGRPSWENVPLRGFNYMNDHRKVLATRTLMKVIAVDCFSTGKKRLDHVAAHPQNRMDISKKRGSLPPFTWIVVYQVPGSPVNYSFVLYMVPQSVAIAKLFDIKNVSDEEAAHIAHGLGLPPRYHLLLRQFFFGKDDTFRNERFKMVPTIEEGPWLVKNAVPNKPALIGKKLTNRYFLGDHYMELDIDVGSSAIANKLTQLSIGYSTKLVVNLSFVLEGRDANELPEEIVGIASVVNADVVRTAVPLAM